MPNDEILTVKETAALLKTTRQQVRKMIAIIKREHDTGTALTETMLDC